MKSLNMNMLNAFFKLRVIHWQFSYLKVLHTTFVVITCKIILINSCSSAAVGNTDALEKPKGVKAILEGMDDLWDEQQYENEYDLSNFMKSLKK